MVIDDAVLAADKALREWDAAHRDDDLWCDDLWNERRRLMRAKDDAIREALER